ncbi:MAG: glycosyltransferase [Actinobacteria bacterium]|nr:glycosyltransferase [Actinomycetota bacterium]
MKSVLPLVRPAFPKVRLSIVGRSPSERVRRLVAYPGVEVTGEVSEMRSWLSRSTVAVCPMINGTGIRNKLLEAMGEQSSLRHHPSCPAEHRRGTGASSPGGVRCAGDLGEGATGSSRSAIRA